MSEKSPAVDSKPGTAVATVSPAGLPPSWYENPTVCTHCGDMFWTLRSADGNRWCTPCLASLYVTA